jgi:hypothetical protein
MLLRLIFIVIIALMASGCATDLKREVHQLESDISQGHSKINSAQTSLRNNPDVYNGQYCVTPNRGPEPRFSCHTKEESRDKGLAICAISYKGCDAVVAAFGSRLNGRDEKFLASQACEMAIAELKGEARGVDAVIVDGSIEYAKDRCENGGFFGKLLGCTYAVAGEIAKFAEFNSCVNTKTGVCYNNFVNWQNAPSRRKSECENNLAIISREQSSVRYKSSQLQEKKNSFMWKLFGD